MNLGLYVSMWERAQKVQSYVLSFICGPTLRCLPWASHSVSKSQFPYLKTSETLSSVFFFFEETLIAQVKVVIV